MINYSAFVSLAVALTVLMLGEYIYYRDPKNKLNGAFRMYAVASAYGSFIEAMLIFSNSGAEAAAWQNMSFVWPFIILAAYRFSVYYTGNERLLRNKAVDYSVIISTVLIALHLILLKIDMETMIKLPIGGYSRHPGASDIFTTLTVIWSSVLTIVPGVLTWNYMAKETEPVKKKQAFILFLSFVMTFVFSTLFQGILPSNDIYIPFSMSILTLIRVGLVGYAMLKFDIFKVTSETAAANILDTIQEMVVLVGNNSKIIKTNKAVWTFTGYKDEDLVNESIDIILPDFIKDNKRNLAEAMLRDGFAGNLEALCRPKIWEAFPVVVSASIISDKRNEKAGFVFVCADITERKHMEYKLEQNLEELTSLNSELEDGKIKLEESYEKLRQVDRLKNDFISMVSHELRTPLTSIKGFLQFLLHGVAGPITTQQKEFLLTIGSNAERLLALINELLDMSKIESGTFSIKRIPSDIVKTIRGAINDIAAIAMTRGIKLNLKTEFKSFEAEIDEYRMSQVIINLLNNSLKFSPKDSEITVMIEKEAYENMKIPDYAKKGFEGKGSYLLVTVKDQGVGIPAEFQERVFDRFYQVSEINTRKYQGVGLGLAITKEIIKEHEGIIWAASEGHNMGSSFCFLVPVK